MLGVVGGCGSALRDIAPGTWEWFPGWSLGEGFRDGSPIRASKMRGIQAANRTQFVPWEYRGIELRPPEGDQSHGRPVYRQTTDISRVPVTGHTAQL